MVIAKIVTCGKCGSRFRPIDIHGIYDRKCPRCGGYPKDGNPEIKSRPVYNPDPLGLVKDRHASPAGKRASGKPSVVCELEALSRWRYPFSGDQIQYNDERLTDWGYVSGGFWCLFERKKIFINLMAEVMVLKLKKADHDSGTWMELLKAQTGIKDENELYKLWSNLWSGSGGFRE